MMAVILLNSPVWVTDGTCRFQYQSSKFSPLCVNIIRIRFFIYVEGCYMGKFNTCSYQKSQNFLAVKLFQKHGILLIFLFLFSCCLLHALLQDRVSYCKTKYSSWFGKVSTFKLYEVQRSKSTLNFDVMGWPWHGMAHWQPRN